jgi:GTPase
MIDVATIKIRAGDGGSGIASFRREKFVPLGGPDGGDGGDGGSVYFVADHNKATLLDFRAKPVYSAQKGDPGGKKKMTGKDGDDLYVKVPVGTLVYQVDGSGEILIGDMVEDGQTLLVAKGGRGGKGNYRFKSSVNQAPEQFTKGTEGEVKEIRLEIKLMADIGLVGMPNAGKSTLINQLTRANAKVADYPFTTLTPNLGTMSLRSGKTVIVADIPGLIEGASEGKGLGDEFLRHIERTRVLVHLVDVFPGSEGSEGPEGPEEESWPDFALKRYDVIRRELEDYSTELLEKPEVVVINKTDITEVSENLDKIVRKFKSARGIEVLGISAATGDGIDSLRVRVEEELEKIPDKKHYVAKKPVKLYTIDNLPNRRVVFREGAAEEKGESEEE